MKLYLAPMEEITGYVFRNVLWRHFGCVDKYFTPFISPDNRITKKKYGCELLSANNEGMNTVPQLLTNDPALFNDAARTIADMGYEEININFGCPSNTVTGKFKGSGILRAPEMMDRFLDGVFNAHGSVLASYPKMRISLKTRVGYNDETDFDKAAEVLKRYPFSEITIHPRLKKDMYGGKPRMELFDRACGLLGAKIIYNGDIASIQDYNDIAGRYKGKIEGVMIGRGAVKNPAIFRQIRTGKKMTKEELFSFLDNLFEAYKEEYDAGNAAAKLKEVWSYTVGFIQDEKERADLYKMIVKSKGENGYRDASLVARGRIKINGTEGLQ